jgi:hypothetical protein
VPSSVRAIEISHVWRKVNNEEEFGFDRSICPRDAAGGIRTVLDIKFHLAGPEFIDVSATLQPEPQHSGYERKPEQQLEPERNTQQHQLQPEQQLQSERKSEFEHQLEPEQQRQPEFQHG